MYSKFKIWGKEMMHGISRYTVNRGPVNRGFTVPNLVLFSYINLYYQLELLPSGTDRVGIIVSLSLV